MPHPVEAAAAPGVTRAELGLPEQTYLFLTSFDFTSYVTRKNPLGAVGAFLRAFPQTGGDDVGLVLKMNGHAQRTGDAAAFLAAPELQDPRIRVMGDVLDRRRMLGLLDQCDAFVSLHRSEGFGRLLAEAMLFGKPVIATGYSGNMDYTTEQTACVVDYRLIPVGRNEYPHAGGQHWADPDLEQAAGYMRRLVSDRAWGTALGATARRFVVSQHGTTAVGARYRARLEQLGLL
jgi:glycosyltransferase involved in cell wall biosynthesis